MKSSVALLCFTALLANAAPINHQARRESVAAASPVVERRASTIREIAPKPFKRRQDSSNSNNDDSSSITVQATADVNTDGLNDLADSLFGGFSFGGKDPAHGGSGSPDDSQDPSDNNKDGNDDTIKTGENDDNDDKPDDKGEDNSEDKTTQTSDNTTTTTDDSLRDLN